MEAGGTTSSRSIDLDHLKRWIGRRDSRVEAIEPGRVEDMAATLDRIESPKAGEPLPPLWHWLFFHASVRQNELGDDGHAALGTFLPPVPLPRRMWAGGRLELYQPLRIGDEATQVSTIKAVDLKQGSSGPLLFVTVSHEIQDRKGGVLIYEEQNLVYRERAAPQAAVQHRAATEKPEWSMSIVPSPALLFRYSALTFNAHRIHYDFPYATGIEGYPGLVVHGPLIATFLLELLHRFLPEAQIRSFTYRAVSPLFHMEAIEICGRPGPGPKEISLWAQTKDGRLAMSVAATLATSDD